MSEAFSKMAQSRCQFFYGCSVEDALGINEGMPLGRVGSPSEIYRKLKWMAEGRDDVWEMSFVQWKGIWDTSGKWALRGLAPGKYCMRRKNPKGPHSIENCAIVQCRNPANGPDKFQCLAKKYGVDKSDFKNIETLKFVRQRFIEQRQAARRRGIEWRMTFSEWWQIWKESGMWATRGRCHAESAVMSRAGDVGPYSRENVRIVSLSQNFSEYRENRTRDRRAA